MTPEQLLENSGNGAKRGVKNFHSPKCLYERGGHRCAGHWRAGPKHYLTVCPGMAARKKRRPRARPPRTLPRKRQKRSREPPKRKPSPKRLPKWRKKRRKRLQKPRG